MKYVGGNIRYRSLLSRTAHSRPVVFGEINRSARTSGTLSVPCGFYPARKVFRIIAELEVECHRPYTVARYSNRIQMTPLHTSPGSLLLERGIDLQIPVYG
jgi:hypothetical protein